MDPLPNMITCPVAPVMGIIGRQCFAFRASNHYQCFRFPEDSFGWYADAGFTQGAVTSVEGNRFQFCSVVCGWPYSA